MSATIARRTVTPLSAWVSLVERDVRFDGGESPNLFHSLRQADYISVLAVTADGRVPVVRQFRPALECQTLELPGGLRDGDEDPAQAVMRELLEETGHECPDGVVPLGDLTPDTGRLENRFWCYFAPNIRPVPGWVAEAGVQADMMDLADLKQAVQDGRMNHALHIALVGLAALRGLI